MHSFKASLAAAVRTACLSLGLRRNSPFLSLHALLFIAGISWAGGAEAGVTVDLIWLDTGTSSLTLTPSGGGPANGSGPGSTCGFNAPAGRCMKVVWTLDEGVFFGSNSVSFDSSSGLSAVAASFLNKCPEECGGSGVGGSIPVGKNSLFRGFPNPTVRINNVDGLIDLITGSVNELPPGDGTTALPAGTYAVGTVIWDVSNASGVIDIASFIDRGLDVFFRPGDSNEVITDITLRGAVLTITPEPSTASLACLGLLALGAIGRQRRN